MPAIFILSYRQPWRIRYLHFLLYYYYLFHLQHKKIEAYEQLAGRCELYGLLQEETDQKINALLPFPLEHPVAEDKLLATWGVRFLQIKNSFAFYAVEESQVTVIRFLYAKSDWVSILRAGVSLV